MGISIEKLIKLKQCSQEIIYYDANINEGNTKLIDMIEDKNNDLINEVTKIERCDLVKRIFAHNFSKKSKKDLTFKEKKVLKYRYGFINDTELTLDEIGQRYKLTRERIRQIENKAQTKLRRICISKKLITNPIENNQHKIENGIKIQFTNKLGASYIPSHNEIIEALLKIKPEILKKKNELFEQYKKVALNSGYIENSLLSIEIFNSLHQRYLPTPKNTKIKKGKKQNEQNKKLSVKDLVEIIADLEPDLLDNDRAFCKIFDEFALDNGYTKENLPKYWTIGRAIFNYKQEHNIKANLDALKRSSSTCHKVIKIQIHIGKEF